ncbi:MAG: hypothetical protein PHI79_01395 [Sulfurovaceae bacterium]|nr:hypothetical protein [Sulfurovaceae bacterium]
MEAIKEFWHKNIFNKIVTIFCVLIIIGALGSISDNIKSNNNDKTKLESKIEFREAKDQKIVGFKKMIIYGSNQELYVSNNVLINIADIDYCILRLDENGARMIEIILTKKGKEKFSIIANTLIGKRLAVIINDNLVSAPIVFEKLTGDRITIPIPFPKEEARQIIDNLNRAK